MMTTLKKPQLVVGISGATGIIYGIRLLQCLRETGIETHLIMSNAAHQAAAFESSMSTTDIHQLATRYHKMTDIAALVASGSYKTMGMIVAPCSMRTLADIASGTTSNLLTRAADVVLKERRKLVLMTRESPLHLGHIRNMAKVTEMGAIVAPLAPAFYNKPETIDDLVNHSVGRVLDLFDIDVGLVRRWGE